MKEFVRVYLPFIRVNVWLAPIDVSLRCRPAEGIYSRKGVVEEESVAISGVISYFYQCYT